MQGGTEKGEIWSIEKYNEIMRSKKSDLVV